MAFGSGFGSSKFSFSPRPRAGTRRNNNVLANSNRGRSVPRPRPRVIAAPAARQYIAPIAIPAPTVNAPGAGGCCAGSGAGDYKNTSISTIVNANRTSQFLNGLASAGKPVPPALVSEIEALRNDGSVVSDAPKQSGNGFMIALLVIGAVAIFASKR